MCLASRPRLLPGTFFPTLAVMTKTFFFLLCCLLPALFLSSCSARQEPYEKGTLRINLGAEPPSLDWHVSTDSASFDVVSNIMVGLTQYQNDLSCTPACAASWEISDGGKTYTFHLRKDLRWTDGKPLLAGDFEYAWKRLLNPATASQYAFFLYEVVNAYEYNTGKLKDAGKLGARALDDYTFEVRLRKPAAFFIYLTAFCPTYPQRKDVVEGFGDRWTEPGNIVTNGPFKLYRWEHEYKIELVANETFFEGEPALKKIKLFMIPEQSTAFALYENNELDYVDNRSFSTPDVERYRKSPEYSNIPLLRGNYVGFNVKKAPFTDVRVRRAFSMAIDRAVFPRILRRGERPAANWIPPGLAGHDDHSGPPFDAAAARLLLQEAGFGNPADFPKVALLYPNREDVRVVVEAIQDQIKRNLGIRIDLVNQEWKVYLQTLHRDAPPVYRASWGADFPDPETFMNLFTTHNGNNHTGWSNPKYDDLVSRAAGEQDQDRRADLYRQADVLLCKEEAPIVVTYLATQNLMVKPWVKGIALNPLDLQFFKTVTVGQP